MKDEDLELGPDGEAIGHHYEDVKNEAYPDPATGGEPWTCGIGCTGQDSEGNKIGPGTVWDDQKVMREWNLRVTGEFGPGVKKAVTVEMNQKEYDALVDLAYNIGLGHFRDSTLLRKLNAGDRAGAADEFPKWNKGGGKVMKGLQRRRWAERHVFLGGAAADGIAQALKKYP